MFITFIRACQSRDKKLIKTLLEEGGKDLDLQLQDELGNSALHYICTLGDLALVEKIINAGTNIAVENNKQETPLHLAAINGETSVIQLLLKKGADLNARNKEGLTPLMYAIRGANIPTIKLLISSGADKFALTNSSLSAEDFIKAEGLDELIPLFKENAPKPDTQGNSPIHHAVNQNGLTTVRNLLMSDKSMINVRNNHGLTPLLVAISKLNYGISDLLLHYGADPNLERLDDGNTPLHIAAENGIVWLGEILIEYGAKLNTCNKEGATPLIVAMQGQQREFISLLLDKGASQEYIDKSGKSVRDYAMAWGAPELVEILDAHKPKHPSKK
jgi:ankyrin repeat protein